MLVFSTAPLRLTLEAIKHPPVADFAACSTDLWI
jgi:hypothetical protein